MSEVHDSVRRKVQAIFSELVRERVRKLNEPGAAETRESLATILAAHYPLQTARDIAFHLADWAEDAAFVLAAQLFPERFTPEEIHTGITMFLIHAPNHVAAAGKLAGHPLADVFKVGIFDASDPLISD